MKGQYPDFLAMVGIYDRLSKREKTLTKVQVKSKECGPCGHFLNKDKVCFDGVGSCIHYKTKAILI